MNAHILKVPYDSGHRCERMARGPGYLISKQLLPGVPVEAIETEAAFITEIQAAFDLGRQISMRTRQLSAAGKQVVVLSGNCNSAIGTVSGLGTSSTGILWFDAHGEFHTPETTRSGFLDGMPLSILTGRSWRTIASSIPDFAPVPDQHIALVGARNVDPEEEAALAASCIHRAGTQEAAMQALDRIAVSVRDWYVHLDLDVLDPSEATTNQWTCPSGLRAAHLEALIRHARTLHSIAGIAIASFDPECDADGRGFTIARDLLHAAMT